MSIPTKNTMTITKLSDHIGAEVTGIDLRQPVDALTRRRLNEAVVEHIALVVRDQHFDHAQFLAAASIFGEPIESDFVARPVPGVPFVHEVSSRQRNSDGSIKKVGARWHTDHTDRVRPPKHTVLYAVELLAKGGGTSIANMRAGYASLPEDLKRRIDGMQTVNVIVGSGVKAKNNDRAKMQQQMKREPVRHPLVRTNGDDGARALFFHPNKVENIVGMSPEDSQALLDELTARALKPEFVYSHRWRPGDLFLWDNRSALHKANYDYDPGDATQHRLLYRVHIAGEAPR